jgi:hypothetical protein
VRRLKDAEDDGRIAAVAEVAPLLFVVWMTLVLYHQIACTERGSSNRVKKNA